MIYWHIHHIPTDKRSRDRRSATLRLLQFNKDDLCQAWPQDNSIRQLTKLCLQKLSYRLAHTGGADCIISHNALTQDVV